MWHAVAARSPAPSRSAALPEKTGRPPSAPPAAGPPADVVTTKPRRSEGPRVKPKNGLDRYFSITARRSTVGREIRGGVTTFSTRAYIVLLTPIILSGADIPGAPLPFGAVAAVTALV